MKRLLFLIFISPLIGFCQKGSHSHKTALGISISPDYSYRRLKGDGSAAAQTVINSRNTTEVAKFGYTAGLKMSTGSDKQWTFDFGLLYSDKGERTKKLDAIFTPNPVNPTKVTLIYHYIYLDIPVKASYFFPNTKQKGFFFSIGALPGIFLNRKTNHIYEYSDGHTTKGKSKGTNLSPVNIAVTAGIGYYSYLAKNLFFKIEPTYRHSLTSISNTPVKSYLYSAGLDFGVFYKLSTH